MAEVRAMLGHAVHHDEPLMMAGLDSRGGMALRRTLAESLGMQVRLEAGVDCAVKRADGHGACRLKVLPTPAHKKNWRTVI